MVAFDDSCIGAFREVCSRLLTLDRCYDTIDNSTRSDILKSIHSNSIAPSNSVRAYLKSVFLISTVVRISKWLFC